MTRVLFGIADVVLGILLLGCVAALINIFFTVLAITFPGGSEESRTVLAILLTALGLPPTSALAIIYLAVALVFVIIYMASYYLLLKKQVIGFFVMASLDVLGLLIWSFEPVLMIGAAMRWLVLGSPWLLTWMDLKKRGALGH